MKVIKFLEATGFKIYNKNKKSNTAILIVNTEQEKQEILSMINNKLLTVLVIRTIEDVRSKMIGKEFYNLVLSGSVKYDVIELLKLTKVIEV